MRALWRTTGEIVALKQVDKASMESMGLEEQLINEVNIMNRLQHPNILQLKACFEDQKTVYMVMELATDGSLFRRIEMAMLPEPEVVGVDTDNKIMVDVLRGVTFMHSQQPPIVHRDIKPENLLCFGSIVKLADFGSANSVNKILKETVCGTPEYLAPEMIRKQGHCEKLDVWCAGILFFELLFRKTPFSLGLNNFKTLDKERMLVLQTEKILVENNY